MNRLLVGAVAAASLVLAAPASAATTVVTPTSLDGWSIEYRRTASAAFVNGPGTPPLGVGSVRLSVGANGDSGAQLINGDYDGVKLSDLTALSYSTYVQSNLNCQAPYLMLYSIR